jgi:hypothetical protein
MNNIRFYDQILSEIEAGNVHDGIILLAGMLDAAGGGGDSFDQAVSELKAHSLFNLLAEDPLCALAARESCSSDALINLISVPEMTGEMSSTGRRLHSVTSQLTFARAVRERRAAAGEKIIKAWQNGSRVCLLGVGQLRAVDVLAGQNLSNITLIVEDAAQRERVRAQFGGSIQLLGALSESAQEGFDLICAAEMPDQCDAAQLGKKLAALRGCLSDHGKILMASFVPQHLGTGWRTACLNWKIHCHDEQSMAVMAEAAGLSSRTYRDATDCIVWSELTRPSPQNPFGRTENGH